MYIGSRRNTKACVYPVSRLGGGILISNPAIHTYMYIYIWIYIYGSSGSIGYLRFGGLGCQGLGLESWGPGFRTYRFRFRLEGQGIIWLVIDKSDPVGACSLDTQIQKPTFADR